MTKRSANKKAPIRRKAAEKAPRSRVGAAAGGGILASYAVHNPDVAWRIVDGEAAIVTPADGTLHLLNEVGTAVWLGTERAVRLSSVVEKVLEQFEVRRAVAERDVAAFAEELASKAMLVVARRRQDLPVSHG